MNIVDNPHEFLPLLIAWEVTRTCNLNCKHCRAAAKNRKYDNELATEQCFRLLDNIAGFSRPIIILTGGEPMLREDIYDIARHGHELGLRMVMAPCGVLITDETIQKMLVSGIQCISISIDGATAKSHDGFRRVPGAFDIACQAIEAARRNGMPFQINTTITRHNLREIPAILKLAENLGAITFNPFLLVPTGRGKELADQEITPQQYEETLQWLSDQRGRTSMVMRVTCAPHYQRIIRQKPAEQSPRPAALSDDNPSARDTRTGAADTFAKMPQAPHAGHLHSPSQPFTTGCMGGKSFAFISHTGKVQICGFLEIEAGDLAENNFDFEDIWKNSPFLREIRAVDHYDGKCGWCEFRKVCGGCRARAYSFTNNYLASEPFCVYEPRRTPPKDREPVQG